MKTTTTKNRAVPMSADELELAKIHWPSVYIVMDGDIDPHTEFANLMGTSRQRAKEIAFMFPYVQRDAYFFKMHWELCEMRGRLVARVSKLLKELGQEESAYQIMDKAELEAEALRRERKMRKRGLKY